LWNAETHKQLPTNALSYWNSGAVHQLYSGPVCHNEVLA
jgi:hypothetical protein